MQIEKFRGLEFWEISEFGWGGNWGILGSGVVAGDGNFGNFGSGIWGIFGNFAGSEIDCADRHGNTPLHVAARYGHELLISTLMTNGADTAR